MKKVFDDLRVEQAEWTGTYMDNHVQESIDWSKKTYNVEFIELSADEKAKWDALLQPITDAWIKDANSKGLPGDKIVEDIKALKAKYAK